MSVTADELTDLTKADEHLEQAWRSLDKASRAMPVKHPDRHSAKLYMHLGITMSYLASMVYTQQSYVQHLIQEVREERGEASE